MTRVSFLFSASSFFLQCICHKIDTHGTIPLILRNLFSFLSKNSWLELNAWQTVCFQNSQEIAWVSVGLVLMDLGGKRKSSLLTPFQIEHNQYGFLIYCSLSKFTHHIDQGVWNALSTFIVFSFSFQTVPSPSSQMEESRAVSVMCYSAIVLATLYMRRQSFLLLQQSDHFCISLFQTLSTSL